MFSPQSASDKPPFKCGIYHHIPGSPYNKYTFNMNYKKMSSIPAKHGQSFAPPNFHFKYNFTGVKKRSDKPVLKSVCNPKIREVSKTDVRGIDSTNSETVE
jgi:hypothetical protein